MRRIKWIVGWVLLIWGALIFLPRPQPTSPPSTQSHRYVDIAASLTPFVFLAVGLSLVLSARRMKKL